MSKTTQNNASKKAPTQKAATTKKPATTSAKKTPSKKKTVPATPDDIMKYLESDSKDRKADSKALAEGQIKIVDLINALFGRTNQNLVNHNKSMLNAKDEVVAKVNGRFDQLDDKLDEMQEGFNEKLDEIKEAKEGPVLTGGLIGVTVLVAIVAVIIMVIAAALNGKALFEVIVLGIFSGIVAAGIALFFGLFRSR